MPRKAAFVITPLFAALRLRSLRTLLWVVIALAPIGWGGDLRGAEPPVSPEYQVKAAFIYNFVKFVEWPGDQTSSASTITLGILGRDPFGEALDQVKGKLAKGRRIVVVHFRRIEEVRECDLLFISESERPRLSHILKSLQNSRVLTVADQEGFCEAGGMINLVSANRKVYFEINAGAAARARFRISSQLLKLARSVLE